MKESTFRTGVWLMVLDMRRRSRGRFRVVLVGAGAVLLSGCTTNTTSGKPTTTQVATSVVPASPKSGTGSAGAGVSVGTVSSSAGHDKKVAPTTKTSAGTLTFLTEPQAGIQPWLNAIDGARSVIELNEYLLTDTQFIDALRSAAGRGVQVDVIVDGHPYGDASAPGVAVSALAGSGVNIKVAPSRFEGSYSFDHAKYLLVDPGQPDQVAIVGSPNATASAFDGSNLEDAVETTRTSTITAIAEVFRADWIGARAGLSPRSSLLLSPGSGPTIASLLGETGPVEVMAEELGDAPACYRALSTHGSGARVLVPAGLSREATGYATQLVRAGVQVRTLANPYMHAKLIVTSVSAFFGSENLSIVSFNDNREVGIVTSNTAVRNQALGWFNEVWNQATTWKPASGGSAAATPPAATPPSGSVHSYPYLKYGATESQVAQLWGSPSSTSTTTYDGYPEVVWIYPAGRVYFENGAVSYIQRTG